MNAPRSRSALAHTPFRVTAFVALLAAWAPAAGAQAPDTQEDKQQTTRKSFDDTQREREAREARRVIQLADGRVLRARARREGDLWFVQQGDRWSSIPVADVARASTERKLLSEARQRSHRVRLGDAEGHFEVARWMESEGLHKEAVHKLDTVLKYEPDHGGALALLERIPVIVHTPVLDVPEAQFPGALERVLQFAANVPPTARETIIEDLARLESQRDRIVEALGSDLTHYQEGRRSFAALTLRRLYVGEHVLRLIGRAVLDVSPDVRRQAAFALRDMQEPGLIEPVLKALDSDNPLVRMNADEALGNMGYAAAVEPLMANLVALSRPQSSGGGRAPGGFIFTGIQVAYVADFDVEIAQAASIADPQISVIQGAAMLEARSHGVSGYTVVTHKKVVRRSLEQLTGAQPGDRIAQWERWWDQNRDRWRAKAGGSGADSTADASGGASTAKE